MPNTPIIPASPMVIIVMGVSGCGKSTLARVLAEHFQCEYVEADDYHTPLAVSLMASGTPLTDAHREPWIKALCEKLQEVTSEGRGVVMAYSGLRAAHRARFRALGLPLQFIHLVGEKDLIRARMQARTNHFMPAGLVDSQFAALESTMAENDVVEISVDAPVETIITEALAVSEKFLTQYT